MIKRRNRIPISTWLAAVGMIISLCVAGIAGVAPQTQSAAADGSKQPHSSDVEPSALSKYARDITKLAKDGRLTLPDGHTEEISRAINVLSRRDRSNPLLVGDNRSGQAAIVKGIALKIVNGDVPDSLRNKRIYSLNLEALLAGAVTVDVLDSRLNSIFAEVENARGQVILFVNELPSIVGGSMAKTAAIAKFVSALSNHRMYCVGSTTQAFYNTFLSENVALSSQFQRVDVMTASPEAESATSGISSDASKSEVNSDDTGFVGDTLSPDLREMVNSADGNQLVKVIVQASQINDSNFMESLRRDGAQVTAELPAINAMAVEMPVKSLEKLASNGLVNHISSDQKIEAFGHITATTGADLVRQKGSLPGLTIDLDGKGITVAVLDSGMELAHSALAGAVRYSQDFTGENRIDDPFGHGTHVASAIVGQPAADSTRTRSSYDGIATGASLVNLRVLNSQGTGKISSILSALNWVLANKSKFNIRVVNMSLGSPAIDSYKNDPICRTVRTLVDAGIVVVAAAGNNGKNSAGQKVYGQIHSPGDEPSALTVGAVNTYGTDSRSDDGITSYSSRGPTRGSWTDANGVKRYDNLAKPDISAPGNKIIEAEADGNLLVTKHPELDASFKIENNKRFMYLSGTSMATPMVSGAVALLLQVNSNLTPNLVKSILMYTAQPLAGYNQLEQGTGELNIEGAVRLALLVQKNTATLQLGSPLLITNTLPAPQTTIAGQTFTWAQGLNVYYTYVTGTNLIAKYQGIYGLGVVMSDGFAIGDGLAISDNTMVSDGVVMGDNIMTSAGVVMGDGVPFLAFSTLFGNGLAFGDGLLVGDGVVMGDGLAISDGIVMSDMVVSAQSAMIHGDDTGSMK